MREPASHLRRVRESQDVSNNKLMKKTPQNKKCSPREATFSGLRDILFEELNLLRSGEITTARARVTSQLARRIIEAATLDLFSHRLLGDGSPAELKRLMSNNVQT